MLFYNYLKEIKNRFILILICCFFSIFVCYHYKEIILFVIIQSNNCSEFYFIFTNVTEILYVYLDTIMFFNIQIFFCYFLYNLFYFFSSALFKSEFLYIIKIFKIIFIFWIFSLFVLNKFIIPISWNFFLSFQQLTVKYSFTLYFESKITEYLAFYKSSYYLCTFFVQFFLFCFFYFNKNSILQIKKYRKIYYFSFLLIVTFLIPPDIFFQLIFSFILLMLYELFLFFCFFLPDKFLIG